jgi:hypothetical protein
LSVAISLLSQKTKDYRETSTDNFKNDAVLAGCQN